MFQKNEILATINADLLKLISGKPNVCFSGGATGADIAWGKAARMWNHEVIHFVFEKHKNLKILEDRDIFVLSKRELEAADDIMKIVNKRSLHRSFPAKFEGTTNLIRRNFYQVYPTRKIYAIADIDENTVAGGTAWAVEAFKFLKGDDPTEIYTFDQKQNSWFVYTKNFLEPWEKMVKLPPKPSGLWTGIGTRDLVNNGRQAIEDLFGQA